MPPVVSNNKTQRSLLEFFPSPSSSAKRPSRPGPPPSPAVASSVPGLTLLPNFIDATEERNLLAFLDAQPWRTDLSRRTMHFGGTYCLMPPRGESSTTKPEILQAPPIPVKAFGNLMAMFVAQGIYQPDNLPEYCIVNEYRKDQGISAHVENFTFGEPVCSLSLGDSLPMRFHQLSHPSDGSVRSGKAALAAKTGVKHEVQLEGRSLLVLKGEARSKWQHEIMRSKRGRKGASGEDGEWRRVSLTFRVKK